MLAILIVRPFDMANFRSRVVALDGHLAVTIEMAVNEAYCGVPLSIDGLGLGTTIQENPAFDDMPLRQVIETKFGSLSSFCSKKKYPFTNNENALYFAYAAALRLWPSASTIGLAELATAARVLMIGFMAFTMVVLGFGAFWAFVSVLLGLKLHVVLIETHLLSAYPFMTFQLAVLCAMVALGYAAGSQCGWSTLLRLAYGAVLGLATVAIWNMRTTHGLIAIVALACVGGLLLLRGREFAAGTNRWTSAAVTTASCLVVESECTLCYCRRSRTPDITLPITPSPTRSFWVLAFRKIPLPSRKISDGTTRWDSRLRAAPIPTPPILARPTSGPFFPTISAFGGNTLLK